LLIVVIYQDDYDYDGDEIAFTTGQSSSGFALPRHKKNRSGTGSNALALTLAQPRLHVRYFKSI
jgi:hypothetical protein